MASNKDLIKKTEKQVEELKQDLLKAEKDVDKYKKKLEKIEDRLKQEGLSEEEKQELKKERDWQREQLTLLRMSLNTIEDMLSQHKLSVLLQKLNLDVSDEIKSFYAALQEAQVADGFLKLPLGATFLGRPSLPNSLFVRKAYEDLHALIHHGEYASDPILLLGNPGIGKSFFSYYELHQLVKKLKPGEFIVYESMVYDLYLIGDNKCVRYASCSEQRRDPPKETKYYLFDAGSKSPKKPYILGNNCKSIVFSSPDPENYKDFLKHTRNVRMYMPTWSYDELSGCGLPNSCGLDSKSLEERFRMFGGIPRAIFAKDTKALESDIHLALNNCDVSTLTRFLHEGSNKINHILHLEVGSDYREFTVKFASPFVTEKFCRKLDESASRSLLKFIIDTRGQPANSAARGQVFEVWAHRKLSSGGTFKIKELFDHGASPETELKLKKMTHFSFSGVEDLRQTYSEQVELGNNFYLQPTKGNFGAVDSLSKNMGFQMTVAESHPIKMQQLNDVLLAIGVENNFKLYFVVPEDVYESFDKKQSYLTKEGKVARQADPTVYSVQQYVLCLPLSDVMPTQ